MIDPVMVAESGAVLLDDEAREALVERLLPLATVVDPEHPRGAGADRAGGGGEPGGAGPRRCSQLGPRGGRRHRRPQRGPGRPLLRRRAAGRDPRRAPPRRRRPRLRLHPLLGAGGLPGPRRRAAGGGAQRPRASPPRRSAPACAGSAPGPGPVDVLGLSDPHWVFGARSAAKCSRLPARPSRFRRMSTNGAPRPPCPVPARRPSSTAPTAPTRAPT